MSVERRIILHCDHPGCERVYRGADHEPVSQVRLHAFGMDWNYKPGVPARDYCPLHDTKSLSVVLGEARS